MDTQTITIPRFLPSGEIVAVDITEESYLEKYAEAHHEWVRGFVVKMSPVSLQHDKIVTYLRDLLRAYFSLMAATFARLWPGVGACSIYAKLNK